MLTVQPTEPQHTKNKYQMGEWNLTKNYSTDNNNIWRSRHLIGWTFRPTAAEALIPLHLTIPHRRCPRWQGYVWYDPMRCRSPWDRTACLRWATGIYGSNKHIQTQHFTAGYWTIVCRVTNWTGSRSRGNWQSNIDGREEGSLHLSFFYIFCNRGRRVCRKPPRRGATFESAMS